MTNDLILTPYTFVSYLLPCSLTQLPFYPYFFFSTKISMGFLGHFYVESKTRSTFCAYTFVNHISPLIPFDLHP
ncbi:hypothetical protein RchiOBHm_Chr2g0125671 [Rosa chinensis]|uniref:Uncharacterized protein n=1 Tax=Rosa chinensis TaxID=74649 RepID=A0A2P6RTM4_ROSCH|nr:hypothetical protein RchiOBHm_Chr2g0125671 [Rosa chinensis]